MTQRSESAQISSAQLFHGSRGNEFHIFRGPKAYLGLMVAKDFFSVRV